MGQARRLDGWKAIADYLQRDVRTVQRWEKSERLPVHRHAHARLGSAYAFADELDGWRASRDSVPGRSVDASALRPPSPQPVSDRYRDSERRWVTALSVRFDPAAATDVPPRAIAEVLEAAAQSVARTIAPSGAAIGRNGSYRVEAIFGLGPARENEGLIAIRAADAALRAIAAENLPVAVAVRIGVATGVVVHAEGAAPVQIAVAEPARLAARVADLAAPNEILVTEDAASAVAAFVDTAVAGAFPSPQGDVAIRRVVRDSRFRSAIEAAARRGLTPFVGRSAELGACGDALQTAAEGNGSVIVVVGEPGVGKSRLLHEFHRRLVVSDVRVLEGRCDAQARTTPYGPFIDVVRNALGVRIDEDLRSLGDRVVDHVAALDPTLSRYLPLYFRLLSFTVPGRADLEIPNDELGPALQEALLALVTVSAQQQPTVLLLEDWHWADSASTETLQQLCALAPSFPLVIIVTARDPAPALVASRVLWISGLDRNAIGVMAAGVVGAPSTSRRLTDVVHARTAGNPFFVEELCRALVERQAIRIENGEADLQREDMDSIAAPTSVQAVIRMRLDAITGAARGVLRVASVIGRDFSYPILVRTLVHVGGLAESLSTLQAAGLIRQVQVHPEPVFRFKHAVTQEVAYDTLLVLQRRVLHLAVARAIEQVYGDRLDAYAEVLTSHYARGEAWPDAIRWGRATAAKAAGLGRFDDARRLLEHVVAWIAPLDTVAAQPLLVDALLELERACEMLGARGEQQRILERIADLTDPVTDPLRTAAMRQRQGELLVLQQRFDQALESLLSCLELRRAAGDATGEREALVSIGFCQWHRGRYREAIHANEAALAIDRRLADPARMATDFTNLATVWRNLGEHARALACIQEAIAVTGDRRSRHLGYTLQIKANIQRDLGDPDAALATFMEALDVETASHALVQRPFTMTSIANLLFDRGDIEQSLAWHQSSLALSRDLKYPHGILQSLRSLGDVLTALDRREEAIEYLEEAIQLAEQLKDRHTAASLMRRLGTLLEVDPRRTADAMAAYDRALELYQDLKQLPDELETERLAARLARLGTKNLAAAVHRYERAAGLAHRASDRAAEADIRNTLAILAWEHGDDAAAIREYERARILLRGGNSADRCVVAAGLAACLLRHGSASEAVAAADEALRLSRRAGEPALQARVLGVKGDALLAAGQAKAAKRCFQLSLGLREQLGDRRGQGWMIERLAQVTAATADRGCAAELFQRALNIASEIGDSALAQACGHRHADQRQDRP